MIEAKSQQFLWRSKNIQRGFYPASRNEKKLERLGNIFTPYAKKIEIRK